MQERHGLINTGYLNTESPMPLPEIYQRSIGNRQINRGAGFNDENKNNKTETNTMFSLRDFNEENIKIYYITPVLLYISCNMFYENLFLSLQLKWYQELNRLLKIEIKIPEEISLHEYFEVNVKIRNISSKVMNLLIEMKENEGDMASNKVNNSSINLGSLLFSIKISINSFIKEISDFESFNIDFSTNIIEFE